MRSMKNLRVRHFFAYPERRELRVVLAIAAGLLAGALAVFFRLALEHVEMLRGEVFSRFHGSWSFLGAVILSVLCASGAWLAAKATAFLCPEAAGSGIPQVKAILLHLQPFRAWRVIIVKLFGGLLAIGAGLSLGREGPTIHIGAAAGKLVGDAFRVSGNFRAHLIACGAGAGLAAAFNAPLAGFVFVLEELRREMSSATYATALVAALMADFVTRFAFGAVPIVPLAGSAAPSLAAVPAVIFVAFAAGAAGLIFHAALLRGVAYVRGNPSFLVRHRALLVGAAVGIAGWLLPQSLGAGSAVLGEMLRSPNGLDSSVALLAVFLAMKLSLTVASYCVGVPGGIFTPMLVQGAAIGILAAHGASALFGLDSLSMTAFGGIGMAAFLAAVTQSPLTGTILVFEMTADYGLLFPLLLGSAIAYLLSRYLKFRPVYDALLDECAFGIPVEVSAGDVPVEIDFAVEAGAEIERRAIQDVPLPAGSLVALVRRSGHEFVPQPTTKIHAGDELRVIVSPPVASAAAQVRRLVEGSPR